MTTKLQNFRNQLSYLLPTFHLIWSAARWWTAAWAILLAAQGLLPAISVYLTRLLVDSLVSIAGAGFSWETVRPTLILAALMAGTMLVAQVMSTVIAWVRTAQSELVQDHLSALVHEKATAVDLAFYEMPDYYDQLHRARADANQRPLALLESAGSLLQSSITLLAMGAMLLPYGAWLPFVLLFSTLPALHVVLRFNHRYHHGWQEATARQRWTQYYDLVLTHLMSAAEIRLFNLGPHFQSAYQRLRSQLRNEHLVLARRQILAQLGAGILALLVSGAAMGWMIWRVLQGSATLGDLALFYQVFNKGQSLLRSLLGSFGQIHTNILYLQNMFDFLAQTPQVASPLHPISAPAALEQGIRFRQISFHYPGAERPALQDFSLTVPAGQVIAIVGANGAGKSTLLKLLCRFYDPQTGSIELDGTDIRDLSVQELRRLITVLFQDPFPYHATAAESIALGDIAANLTPNEIETAARAAGAHEVIERLPQGYDTLLGKAFVGGTELSGGEWQRLALARAFVRRAQIIVLDEPTSALDSWAEADWFDRFRTLANGRTAIIITHRFTIARRADMIHVMDAGRIIESGTHEELLIRDGFYAQSWAAQTQARPEVGSLHKVESGVVLKPMPEHSIVVTTAKPNDHNGLLRN